MKSPLFLRVLTLTLVLGVAPGLACSVRAESPAKGKPAAKADARAAYDAQVRAIISKRWDEVSNRNENILESGTARINFLIAPDGSPRDLRVVALPASGGTLARLTREMVQAMRFPNVPASIVKDSNGKGMPVEFTFTVL